MSGEDKLSSDPAQSAAKRHSLTGVPGGVSTSTTPIDDSDSSVFKNLPREIRAMNKS